MTSFHSSSKQSPPPYEDVLDGMPVDKGDIPSLTIATRRNELATPTPTNPLLSLEKPVAIPQTRYGIGKPYMRAYSDELARLNISKQQFIEFVDELNTVTAGSPAFDFIDAAGEVIGYSSVHDGGLIGIGIQTAAGMGKAGVSLLREKSLVKKVNENLFAPVGLKVELVNGKNLKQKLNLSPETALAAPLAEKEWEGERIGVHERRMAAIQPYVAALSFDLPPPSQPKRRVDTWNASLQRRALAKQEKRIMKSRGRYREELERHEERLKRKQTELQKRIAALEEKRSRKEQKRDERMEQLKAEEEDMKRVERKVKEYEEEFQYEFKYINEEIEEHKKAYEDEVIAMKEDLQEEDEEAYHIEKMMWILVQNLEK